MKISISDINSMIYEIRDQKVMIDSELAKLYNVETKRLKEQVRRNIKRFPKDFMFELTKEEFEKVVANCDHLKRLKYSQFNPMVFTEQGVSMLSSILKSDIAIDVNIKIMRTFAEMRKVLLSNNLMEHRFNKIEKKLFLHDDKFDEIFKAIESKQIKPTQGIFCDGQVFDAYSFVSDLIKSAKKEIILIDNYIDEITLTIFSKIPNIKVTIYTYNISKQLKLDFQKYNTQYNNITLKTFKNSHDRFLIIDKKELYHLGASLKDLGKRWFAFSKMDLDSFDILNRLK